MKYVIVSGGVISGIGKGVIASSTGLLFRSLGYRVTSIKIDPYMNIDAGTMSPLEHGEVFVLADGGEADLDLGNYERYLGVTLTREHNLTTGKIYRYVIDKERRGDYLGKTVQIVPHLTNAIQDWLERVAHIPVDGSDIPPDVCIIELGGTVGDIESAPFVEALRQFQFRVGHQNFALIHVSLVPVIHGELKTKPTQAAIRDLRSLGLTPDIIACRCSEQLSEATISKISMFCHVGPEQVLGVHDVNSTYHVPLMLNENRLMDYFAKRLQLSDISLSSDRVENGTNLFRRWTALTESFDNARETVTIALVGKYVDLQDSYISVVKALEHSALQCGRLLKISWVDSENLEEKTSETNKVRFHEAWAEVCQADGILVPGGFGSRGIEGMIQAARWARENKVPYLGICLGFQVAVIEYARSVLGIKDATSAEFNEHAANPFIVYMPEVDKTQMGGTMRLGRREAHFQSEYSDRSVLRRLYANEDVVYERHRHRYEVNPERIDDLEAAGLSFVAKDETGTRMESFEVFSNPYYVGTQYHPEYLSRVLSPSQPILGLVASACGKLDEVTGEQRDTDF
ncbi:CTP synthase [Wickerhamiella sorbophila]|uniref:CTP synthase n=1 Tax=Wickerhamiella sorbophila TaxID=45607 RepID=A0A2T0FG59_9ASCO|nr:CTP synthase [Wickerhamiella sorbophila]PRT53983.1 CTP synthase [Wickerhamiella sorbophila]